MYVFYVALSLSLSLSLLLLNSWYVCILVRVGPQHTQARGGQRFLPVTRTRPGVKWELMLDECYPADDEKREQQPRGEIYSYCIRFHYKSTNIVAISLVLGVEGRQMHEIGTFCRVVM